ncbi:MAG: GH25 family lysozyme, partial [bacterium]
MMIKIIDVSEHQGKIDWKKVKAAGITGTIIRLGYVTSKGNNLDKQFKNNVTGALNAGVSIGFYLYSYAQDLKRVQQ